LVDLALAERDEPTDESEQVAQLGLDKDLMSLLEENEALPKYLKQIG
jgi:hypothetical protein